MLRLIVMDYKNEQDVIYFNNHTFKFFKKINGISTQLKHKYKTFSSDKVEPTIITVVLGYNCNNKCVYCTQRKFKDDNCDIYKLRYYIDILVKDFPSITNIHFIGGEPLLEFNTITNLVHHYGKKFKYSIITNGLFINKDIANFLIANNFEVTISHDGESQLLQRGKDIFNPLYPEFKTIQQLSKMVTLHIESVLCGDSTTTKERWDYFSRLPIDINTVYVKPVIPYKKEHIPLVPGQNNWKMDLSQLIMDIYEINSKYDWDKGDSNLILDMVRMLANTETKYDPKRTRCPIFNKSIFTINQGGYIQYCHNCSSRIDKVKTIKYMRKDRVEKCKSCPLVLTCTSACRLLDDDCFEVTCNRKFYHNLAYFIYFVHQTFGYVITSIEGEFKHAVNGKFEIAT